MSPPAHQPNIQFNHNHNHNNGHNNNIDRDDNDHEGHNGHNWMDMTGQQERDDKNSPKRRQMRRLGPFVRFFFLSCFFNIN